MTRPIPILFATAALAVWALPSGADSLQEKARSGDPIAACQLVVRRLHACALEKQQWETGTLASKPACIDEPVGAQERSYLEKAGSALKTMPAITYYTHAAVLIDTAAKLDTMPAAEAVETTGKLSAGCDRVAEDMAFTQ
jgi:hypothetical protein